MQPCVSTHYLTLKERTVTMRFVIPVVFYEITNVVCVCDRLCGLVVRVSGYRYRGPGFDPRRYQIF